MSDNAQTQELLTPDAVKTLIVESIAESVSAAIKEANTVSEAERPEAVKSAPEAPAVITRRQAFPSLRRAVLGAAKGRLDGYEAEFNRAAMKAFGYQSDDLEGSSSIIWPTSLDEAQRIFETMGDGNADKVATAIKAVEATKAMNNDSAWTDSGGTAGGVLVPPEFAQSLFAYALTAQNAVRRAGARVYPATSNNVRFPRETTAAGASQIAEAGTMSSADATLAQQSIDVEKQYAMRRWSDELGADSDPAFSVFLENTVIRDLRIQQDIQYLRGSGTTPQITGILNYTGLTSGPSLGTNGRTPTWDDILDAIYNLNAANADANFAIGHPRAINSLRKIKDASGRYLMSDFGTPMAAGGNQANAMLAGFVPFYSTTNLTITQTVGTSTDCTTIIMGDISQVMIVERGGVELMLSPHVYFTTGEMAIRATQRTALVILQPSAVELITGVRP